jgi:hypothetical protein
LRHPLLRLLLCSGCNILSRCWSLRLLLLHLALSSFFNLHWCGFGFWGVWLWLAFFSGFGWFSGLGVVSWHWLLGLGGIGLVFGFPGFVGRSGWFLLSNLPYCPWRPTTTPRSLLLLPLPLNRLNRKNSPFIVLLIQVLDSFGSVLLIRILNNPMILIFGDRALA